MSQPSNTEIPEFQNMGLDDNSWVNIYTGLTRPRLIRAGRRAGKTTALELGIAIHKAIEKRFKDGK